MGGGALVFLNPLQRQSSGLTQWQFSPAVTRMPEPVAPNIKAKNNLVTVSAHAPAGANGVLYALGGSGGGITLYADNGTLVYEYNALIIRRTRIRATQALPAGPVNIEVETTLTAPKPGAPAQITLRANGKVIGQGVVPFTVPLLFTASETLDVGMDLGAPVSRNYTGKAPYAFSGKIDSVTVRYLP